MQKARSIQIDYLRIAGIATLPALLLAASGAQAQVSFATAAKLALHNSPDVHMSEADVRQAKGALSESKDAYVPSITLGSNIGYSYGFPLGEPSIYNVSAHSLAFSFSQRDYIRSARKAVLSAREALKDTRNKVLENTAADYIQLDTDLKKIKALEEQKSYADALTRIERQRVQAGVDPRSAMLKAELTAAQLDLKRVHVQHDAALMRSELASLTGLKPADLQPIASSVPPLPGKAASALNLGQMADSNPNVAAAKADAQSKFYLSMGDKRQIHRPLFTFGMQYSRFAEFNNYNQYFQRFQHNNFDVGIQISIPLFDASRRAKAEQSAAKAVRAQAQAQQAAQKVDQGILKLQQGLTELQAQQRVAGIQSEIAKAQVATVKEELNSGSGQPNTNPVTPQQADQAHIQERERYIEMLDANLSVSLAELNLLRLTGRMESWLQSAPQK